MKRKTRSGWLAALFLSLVFLNSIFVRADILDNWHWRNPSPFPDTMHSVCFGAGKFVAVGEGGVIHTSTDGFTWDAGQRPILFNFHKVIYANGEFVAVGDLGAIVTSSNAVDWIARDADEANDLYAVAFGNGRFVACGANGQLATSTNGINWIPGTDNSVGGSWITFGNGVFVAAGPGTSVEVSADGQTWANFSLPMPNFEWPHALWQAEFGNGKFIAVVSDEVKAGQFWQPGSHFYESSDGTNWTQGIYFPFGPTYSGAQYSHRFLVFLNGSFHEVTDGASGYGIIPISITTDGASYTTKYAPTNAPNAQSMAYGSSKYLLMEQSGKSWVSTDETDWMAAYSGFTDSIMGLIPGVNSNLLVVGPMLLSTNGVNFDGPYAPYSPLYAAAFDGTNYVVVGGFAGAHNIGEGVVYTSTNGVDWVQRTSNANVGLLAICHGPSRWVAVGINGTVISSPNTLAWTLRSSGTANDLKAVSYGNGIYVAVGSGGTVITSSDGASWDVQFSGTVNDLKGVVFQNGLFTAVGSGGTIITSPDGANWTSQTSGTTATLQAIAYGNGSYLVGGVNDNTLPLMGDVFLSSTNGTNWQNISKKIPTTMSLHSIAYVNQSFWITGDNGMLLQSDVADGIPHFAGAMMPSSGGIKLKVILNPAASYRVQFRTNLLDAWVDVYTNSSPISSDTWTDTNASQRSSGYYRIVSP